MSRTYATDEQYERWFKKTCARCGNRRFAGGWWPDGPVCRTCHDRALLVRGTCPGCGHPRDLPGLAPDGQPICTDCAGFRTSYLCQRCGHEGKLHARKLCTRCTFANQLTELLGDDTGHIHRDLAPLFEVLVRMDNPLTGLTWLYRPHVPRFLRGLATGQIPLSHKAFDKLQPWRAATYLREILMDCGLLPAIDKQLLLFDRWLAEHLSSIDDEAHRPVIQQFATWKVGPWLRTRAERGPLSPSTRHNAGAQIMRATEFLTWLAEHNQTLPNCTQAALDRWHASHLGHQRNSAKSFFTWAMQTRRMPKLVVPSAFAQPGQSITHHRRLEQLRILLTDDSLELLIRVACTLLQTLWFPYRR